MLPNQLLPVSQRYPYDYDVFDLEREDPCQRYVLTLERQSVYGVREMPKPLRRSFG